MSEQMKVEYDLEAESEGSWYKVVNRIDWEKLQELASLYKALNQTRQYRAIRRTATIKEEVLSV